MSTRLITLCMRDGGSLTEGELSEINNLYNEQGRDAVFAYGKKNKLLPYLAHAMLLADCDTTFWNEIHENYLRRNQRILTLLETLFDKLKENNIHKACVAENFAAILSGGTCMGCFCSGDVDIYCDDVDIKQLDEIMSSLGFTWSDRHTRKKSFAHEYKSVDAIGEEFWINFQWKPMTRKKIHLYDQRYILKRYHTLFDEAEYYKQTSLKYFKPEAALYLNCVHIASGHYYILPPGIRLYADIDILVRNRTIDWDQFINWVKKDHLGIRSDAVLELAKLQLLTNVPDKAFTDRKKGRKFDRLIDSLIDRNDLRYQYKQQAGFLRNIPFLIKIELLSDGTNVFKALMKRMWVVLADWS